MRNGFTQTQNSFKSAQAPSEAVANANLVQLGAQNQHIKDFGAKDPLPTVAVTAVALQSGTKYRYTVAITGLGWQVGDKVAVQGITPIAYNGYWPIAAGSNLSTSVDLDIGSNPAAAVLTGTPSPKMANVYKPDFTGTSGLDSLVADMLTTRSAGGFMCLTMNKGPLILVLNQGASPQTSDSKIDAALGGSQSGNPGWDAFADLCYEIVARYVANAAPGCGSPLYVQFWNELKGLFDGGLNHWDYSLATGYTGFYNAFWNKVRADARGLIAAAGKNPAAGTDILIGGPYPHINFYSRSDTVPSHAHSNAQIGTVGFADMQGPDVIDFFCKNAAGFDFVCFDGGSKFMDLFEIVGGVQVSTGGLVKTTEGIGSIPRVGAYTGGGVLKQDNVQSAVLTRAQAAQSWQDVVTWIVNKVFTGTAFFCNDAVNRTKPIWISEAHCGNATDTSTGVSGTIGNRNITDANMGLLATDMLAALSASPNSSTMVALYWGSEDRTGTNGGNDNGVTMFHEVDYPNLVYPTNQGTPPGGTVTPVGTAWGIGAGGGGGTIVGDGPSGR